MNLNLLNSEDTLFLMIDIQEKLLNAVFNKDSVQKKSKIIAEVSRILNIPVLVSEQYPQGLGETIDDIKKALLTETKYFTKTTFNALEVLELAQELASYERKNIVLLGIKKKKDLMDTVKEEPTGLDT